MENKAKTDAYENPQGARFLTLDISSSGIGYALCEKGTISRSGVIKAKGRTAKDRYAGMGETLQALIKAEHPDAVFSEAPFIRRSFAAIEYPLKLHGLAEFECLLQEIPYIKVVISWWRGALSFPTNFQGAQTDDYKSLSKAFAKEVLGREPSDDNEADAVCIASAVLKRGAPHSERDKEYKKSRAKKTTKKTTKKAKKTPA